MKIKNEASTSRRDFLRTASLGVGAAAVAGTVLATEEAEAKTPGKDVTGAGYSETNHIRRYYELARI